MRCCDESITTFSNQEETNVPYFGNKPIVTVLYLQNGIWTASGVLTQIKLEPNNVNIVHGGKATGFVKLS